MPDEMTSSRLLRLLPGPIKALYERFCGRSPCNPATIFEFIGHRTYWQLSAIDLSLLIREVPRPLWLGLIPAALLEFSRTGATDFFADFFEEMEGHLEVVPADRQLVEDAIEAAFHAYTERHQLYVDPNCGATLDGRRLGAALRELCFHRLARRPVARFIVALNGERTEKNAMWLLSIRSRVLADARDNAEDKRGIRIWAIDDSSGLEAESQRMLQLAADILLSEKIWREMEGILARSEANDVRAFRKNIGSYGA